MDQGNMPNHARTEGLWDTAVMCDMSGRVHSVDWHSPPHWLLTSPQWRTHLNSVDTAPTTMATHTVAYNSEKNYQSYFKTSKTHLFFSLPPLMMESLPNNISHIPLPLLPVTSHYTHPIQSYMLLTNKHTHHLMHMTHHWRDLHKNNTKTNHLTVLKIQSPHTTKSHLIQTIPHSVVERLGDQQLFFQQIILRKFRHNKPTWKKQIYSTRVTPSQWIIQCVQRFCKVTKIWVSTVGDATHWIGDGVIGCCELW